MQRQMATMSTAEAAIGMDMMRTVLEVFLLFPTKKREVINCKLMLKNQNLDTSLVICAHI